MIPLSLTAIHQLHSVKGEAVTRFESWFKDDLPICDFFRLTIRVAPPRIAGVPSVKCHVRAGTLSYSSGPLCWLVNYTGKGDVLAERDREHGRMVFGTAY